MNPVRNFSLSRSKSNNKKGISNGVKRKCRLAEKDYWLFVILFLLYTNTILFVPLEILRYSSEADASGVLFLTGFADNLPLKDGEKLEFSLRWMGIIGGKSTIEVKEESLTHSEKNSYLVNATLRTVGLADIPFRIRDEFSSLIILSSKEVLPVRWEVIQKEKNYKYEEKTDFNELLKKEPQLQNPLSSLCLLRLKDWKVGDNITVPILVHQKIFPIKVKTVSKEPLKIHGKTFNTILINVAVESVKIDISSAKLKSFKIWLTDDEKKLPVFMKADTSVGIITVLLDNREELLKEN